MQLFIHNLKSLFATVLRYTDTVMYTNADNAIYLRCCPLCKLQLSGRTFRDNVTFTQSLNYFIILYQKVNPITIHSGERS